MIVMRVPQAIACCLVGVVAGACGVGLTTPATTSYGPVGSTSTTELGQVSVARFLRLAEAGTEGTFSATYRIVGDESAVGEGVGVVEIAQLAAAGSNAWPDAVGEWSYRLILASGRDVQWIENGATSEDCWKASESLAWSCRGPGTFQQSEGFFRAIVPYLPGTSLQSIKDISPNLENHLSVFREAGNRVSGPTLCLRDRTGDGTGTWCLTKAGFLASSVSSPGGSLMSWSLVTLLSESSTAPARDFRPAGRLESPFLLPPEG
jgi:hypothetical protein